MAATGRRIISDRTAFALAPKMTAKTRQLAQWQRADFAGSSLRRQRRGVCAT
ncbi:hypothetical protein RvY_13650 [Ramazzottius varieornatus]|uniref:Uncharacterized protein n=1 Tax=Ramazzottius varieornatus TaxID=947166 RepID=A0A1D1VQS3_RAMVA|nr:hypothetical protein RvY_13650 [Ramazzottius varieornatus]